MSKFSRITPFGRISRERFRKTRPTRPRSAQGLLNWIFASNFIPSHQALCFYIASLVLTNCITPAESSAAGWRPKHGFVWRLRFVDLAESPHGEVFYRRSGETAHSSVHERDTWPIKSMVRKWITKPVKHLDLDLAGASQPFSTHCDWFPTIPVTISNFNLAPANHQKHWNSAGGNKIQNVMGFLENPSLSWGTRKKQSHF